MLNYQRVNLDDNWAYPRNWETSIKHRNVAEISLEKWHDGHPRFGQLDPLFPSVSQLLHRWPHCELVVPHICSSMGKVPNIGGKLITHILRLNRAVWTWVSLDCIKWLCLRLGFPHPINQFMVQKKRHITSMDQVQINFHMRKAIKWHQLMQGLVNVQLLFTSPVPIGDRISNRYLKVTLWLCENGYWTWP